MVKKMLPFLGTLPFLRMSSGAMRTKASSNIALWDDIRRTIFNCFFRNPELCLTDHI